MVKETFPFNRNKTPEEKVEEMTHRCAWRQGGVGPGEPHGWITEASRPSWEEEAGKRGSWSTCELLRHSCFFVFYGS